MGRSRATLGLLLALVVVLGPVPAVAQAPSWAEVQQSVLPALQARRAAALARSEAARQYLEGQADLLDAFPEHRGAALDSPAWLHGRLAILDDEAKERARERTARLPTLENRERDRRWADARREALEAEERAGGLERRILLAILGHLERNPALSAQGLAVLREPLLEELRQAEGAVAEAEEADRDALAKEVVAIQAELRRLDVLVAELRRAAVVAGAAGPDPSEDIARLDGGLGARAALERLRLAAPLASPEDREAIEAAQLRWWSGPRLAEARAKLARADAEEIDDPEAAQAEAIRALALAQGRLAALPLDSGRALDQAQREVWGLDRDRAQRLRDRAAELLAAKEAGSADVDADAEAERAEEQARKTREEVEKREAEVLDHSQRRSAELLTVLAAAEQSLSEGWRWTAAVQESARDALRDFGGRLDELAAAAAAVDALPPLDPERRRLADDSYAEVRTLIGDLRTEVTAGGGRILAATENLREVHAKAEATQSRLAAGSEVATGPEADEIRERLRQTLADGLRAAEEAVVIHRDLRDLALVDLGRAKELRRRLRSDVSREALSRDRAHIFDDLAKESALILPNLAALSRQRVELLRELPERLGDPQFLWAVTRAGAMLALLVVLWRWARRRTDRFASAVIRFAAERARRSVARDLKAMRGLAVGVLVPAVDLVAGYLLLAPVRRGSAELGLALLLYLQLAVYRLLVGAFRLAVAQHPEVRPALVTLEVDTRKLALRSVQVLLVWGISRQFLTFFAARVLGADALRDGLLFVFNAVLVLVLLWLAWLWEPRLRQVLGERARERSVPSFLLREHNPLFRAPAGLLAAAAFVSLRLADRLAVGRDRSLPTALMNLFLRYRMTGVRKPATEGRRQLPAATVEAILQGNADVYVQRPESDRALDEAYLSWSQERRRGLVVVVGDEGSGKTRFVRRVVDRLPLADRQVVRARLDARLTTEEDLVRWLSDLCELPAPSLYRELVAPMAELPPTIFVIEEVQRCFLRSVGGFDALRAMLYVMNATGDRHFWLLTLHRPAFRYLSRLHGLVNMSVLRSVIDLPPMHDGQLRELVGARMAAVGLKPRFDPLLGGYVAPDDRAAAVERATANFFRLLADASDGNPSVALRLWTRCLSPRLDPEQVEVSVPPMATNGALQQLQDPELFVLSALHTQDLMTEPELVQSTNMAPSVVRTTVKGLESKALVDVLGEDIRISIARLADVSRTLRRRNFIHGRL
jgi:hypothetical protein